MKRSFDIIICLILLIILLPVFLAVTILLLISGNESIIYHSERVGKNGKLFMMPKFRTMKLEAPDVASHLISNPEKYYTASGHFLRKYSLDELPQLFSVIKGDMSIVGPRPALHNQIDLIQLRLKKDIHILQPGITGWAQINGRDNIPLTKKVDYDYEYFLRKSLFFDCYIIFMTFLKVLRKDSISH